MHFGKQPLILVIFCSFQFTLFHVCKAVFCWKHYKNSVFSRAQLLGIIDSKAPLSRPLPKMALLQPHVPFVVFPCACWKPYFCSAWWLWMGTKKGPFSKNRVATKMRVFCTFRTQIVFANFSKKCHFNKKRTFFLHHHAKTLFSGFFFNVPFPFFHLFSFGLSNIKKKRQKQRRHFFQKLFF